MSLSAARPFLKLVGTIAAFLLLSVAVRPALANGFVKLPQKLEVELALRSLPEGLQAEATVYVRDSKKGFVIFRKGSNGWMAFVARTSVRFYGADWKYSYPSDQLIAQAHHKVGQDHHVIPYFDLELMRIKGVSAIQTKKIIRQRFKDGTYKAPAKGGMSYMLSPIHRAYMEPAKSSLIKTFSFSHYMTYAPHMDATQLGLMDPHRRSGLLDHGGHDSGAHGYIYFMVQPDYAKTIRTKYSRLLIKLCKHHVNWCLPK